MNYPSLKTYRAARLALFSTSLLLSATFTSADTPAGKLTSGSKLDALTAGKTTYQQVQIRSVSARSATITHSGGMASVLLRDLSPELQQRFGYDPATEQAQEEAAKVRRAAAEKQHQAQREAVRKMRQTSPSADESKIDQLLRSFGQAPEVAKQVDLRSRYNELGLWVKSQGFRPSCSVFAIVSALELQNAELNGKPERFSEEYLIWATRKTLNRTSKPQEGIPSNLTDDPRTQDEGFALHEVVTALRTYGIPPRDRVPNRLKGATIETPPDDVVNEARNSRRVSVHMVPGRDGATLVANLVQALNAGVPVPIGMRWPQVHTWRTGYLAEQTTSEAGGHAVTLVGYKSESGRIEDAVFTFKNSWGVDWGADGYGYATYNYLVKNLTTAVVLEVQPETKLTQL